MENTLEQSRHSLAHILATAIKEKYPKAKLGIGPSIHNGFYYDFDFSAGEAPKAEDLPVLEARMRELMGQHIQFERKEISRDEALKMFADEPYKIELIEDFATEGKTLTAYTSGTFTDLCKGGHVENTDAIAADAFTLSHIAGAYWRGSEQNKMLTRIYGLAFGNKQELDAYIVEQEEAKKRDHKKLGKELDLFLFSPLVGSGLPLYTPKGNLVRNAIINYSRALNDRLGFGEVHTPNINKAELFKISGHYDQYKDDMLSVKSQYVDDEMFLKPMNCPQHTQIYASQMRSYRDLPIRYSDFANLYRDERPGELAGLTRLRAFSQDDGHIFCREDQIKDEIGNVLAAIEEALKTYKIDYWMRLSMRDPENKEKYIGEGAVWDQSENIMRELLKEKDITFKEALGEAAFYGPKIDIIAVDAMKREWQISTVQLDFNQPTRFKLAYTDKDGSEKMPIMIHRALVGSPDRFLGILIEHYAGAFPSWLAPVQTRILPVSEKHSEYAHEIFNTLKKSGIRVELDESGETLGKRIRGGKTEKIPYLLVVGDKEVEAKTVTVENRDGEKIGAITPEQFIERIVSEKPKI